MVELSLVLVDNVLESLYFVRLRLRHATTVP